MNKLIITFLIFMVSVKIVLSNPILNYEIKQVADFNLSDASVNIQKIVFKDSLKGITLVKNQDYDFQLFTTSDSGDSWDSISSIDIYNRWVLQGIAPPTETGMVYYDNIICITTQPHIALFGPQPPTDTGVYFISYNYGQTWKVLNFPEKLLLALPQFDESGNLYIIGSNWDFRKKTATRKGIFKSKFANETWEEIPLPILPDSSILSSLIIFSEHKYQFMLTEYKIDNNDKIFSKKYIYRTFDAGKNWDALEIPFIDVSAYFTSENIFWVTKIDTFRIHTDSIKYHVSLKKSTDRGKEWVNQIDTNITLSRVANPILMGNFIAYDDNNIWLRFSNMQNNTQYLTNNGGKDWIEFPKFDSDIIKTTPNFGFYLNKNTIFLLNTYVGNLLYKFTFDIATSVIERADESQFKLFPNPASDYIEITQPSDVYNVQIYDILGVKVLSTPSAAHPPSHPSTGSRSENLRIDVSSLAPGMYFIRIGNKVQKFIKL
ncbi:MAG: T9SS type A sorting domain-containing protein [Desulfobulbaceae bacterium]|nr:T9SS type A sorting domain-containing protein [Desulfobulbaceae bacterium]